MFACEQSSVLAHGTRSYLHWFSSFPDPPAHFLAEQVSRSPVLQHFYAVVTNPTTFDDAIKASAESFYAGVQGHLFVPNSWFELHHVATTLLPPGNGHVWLAFTDVAVEGKYVIAAGPNARTDVSDIIPWEKGEPNGGRNENCAVYAPNYAWSADIACSLKAHYAIEYECPFGQRFNDFGTACIGTLFCFQPLQL
jgi:hypothetical protein